MTVFCMVKYHSQSYPADIPLVLEETAAHMDVASIDRGPNLSLHTEYSYGKRELNSLLIQKYDELMTANKNGVPQLWKNAKWAEQFAGFVKDLAGDIEPGVIEIHPPFSDYTDIKSFADIYKVFEDSIREVYPNTEILLENRCGSVYKGGKFIVSKAESIEELCEEIEKQNIDLSIALDVPQLYTAHNVKKEEQYFALLERMKQIREYIGGVHLWGKRRSKTGRKVSHCGDLNSYFEYNDSLKQSFLEAFADCFNDNKPRKLVLEVNSGNEDLMSIISDLKTAGILFNITNP